LLRHLSAHVGIARLVEDWCRSRELEVFGHAARDFAPSPTRRAARSKSKLIPQKSLLSSVEGGSVENTVEKSVGQAVRPLDQLMVRQRKRLLHVCAVKRSARP